MIITAILVTNQDGNQRLVVETDFDRAGNLVGKAVLAGNTVAVERISATQAILYDLSLLDNEAVVAAAYEELFDSQQELSEDYAVQPTI